MWAFCGVVASQVNWNFFNQTGVYLPALLLCFELALRGRRGFVLLGGRDVDGEPVNGVYVAWSDTATSANDLLEWVPLDEQLALPEPRAYMVADRIGDFFYAIGGSSDGTNAVASVYMVIY